MRPSSGPGFAVALASVTMIGPLAIHLFLPVMPEIKTNFGVSDAVAELTFSITLATMALATLVYGTLSDRFGRRPVLLSGLALFLLGSAVAALAGSVPVLLVGRLFQALGAACSVTLTRAIARDAYGPERLVRAIAYLTMAYTLGPMVAPPLGGLLLDHFGWRSVLWFAFIAGAAVTVASWRLIGETRPSGGAARRSGSIWRDYAALFGTARFTAFVLQSGFASGTFFALASASPFLMESALGRSATEYGFYFIFYPAGYCIGNLISSRLSGRVSIEAMVLVGSIINAVAMAAQAGLVLGAALSPLVIFVPGFFVTFAQGLSLPNAQAGAIQTMPNLFGTASGIGVFCQTLGMALGAQIYGLLADGTGLGMIITGAGAATLALIAGACPMLLRGRIAPA